MDHLNLLAKLGLGRRFDVSLYQVRLEELESYLSSHSYAGAYELAECWVVSYSAALNSMFKIQRGIRGGLLHSSFPITGKKIGVKGNYYVLCRA